MFARNKNQPYNTFFSGNAISQVLAQQFPKKIDWTRFEAGTTYLRENGKTVLPVTCAIAPNHLPRCRPNFLSKRISRFFEANIL